MLSNVLCCVLVKLHVHWSHKVAPCDDTTEMRLDCFCFGCFSTETSELKVGIRKMEHSRDEGDVQKVERRHQREGDQQSCLRGRPVVVEEN